MKIDSDQFDKIAHLARLEFSEKEKPKIMNEMTQIISWVEKLSELNTDDVEPLTSMSLELNNLREDEVGNTIDQKKALSNAPEAQGPYFKVPNVLD